jgi:hypothetical protein
VVVAWHAAGGGDMMMWLWRRQRLWWRCVCVCPRVRACTRSCVCVCIVGMVVEQAADSDYKVNSFADSTAGTVIT